MTKFHFNYSNAKDILAPIDRLSFLLQTFQCPAVINKYGYAS